MTKPFTLESKITTVDIIGHLISAAIVGLIAINFGWWILAILLIIES